MDQVNKITSKAIDQDAESAFDDPKVTCINHHREKKLSRDAEARHISKICSQASGAEQEPSEETPITLAVDQARKELDHKVSTESDDEIHPSLDSADNKPPHIFTEQIEVLETDLNELQQLILERIKSPSSPDKTEETNTAQPIENQQDKAPEVKQIPLEAPQVTENSTPFLQASHREEEATQTQSAPEAAENGDQPGQTDESGEAPLIYAPKTKDESIKSLNRWLNKSKDDNSGYSMTTVASLCFLMIALGGVAGGFAAAVFVAGHQDDQARLAALDLEKERAYSDYKASLSGKSSSDTGIVVQNNQPTGSFNGSSGGGNLSGSNGETPKAAVMLAIPAIREVKNCEEKPDITLAGLRGGRTRIAISSHCHAGQIVKIVYAGVTFNKTLNENGQAYFVLDCFAGDKKNIEFVFSDKTRLVRKPIARDLGDIAKVAIIWKDNINLDLHAFEYAAKESENGHIWEKNPSNIEQALRRRNRTGVGRGFISSSSRGHSDRQNIEVYTFLRASEQQRGVVKLALNHRIASKHPAAVPCTSARQKSVDYTTMTLVRNGSLKTGKAAVMVDMCKNEISGANFNSRAIQDLVIGR